MAGARPVLHIVAGGLIFDAHGQVLLIRENYGRRYYGLPGGAVEPGETPEQAAVREIYEETGVRARVRRLVGIYAWRMRDRWIGHIFLCVAEYVPVTFVVTPEIAEAGWWQPDALPRPINNSARLAIADALAGNFGVQREIAA